MAKVRQGMQRFNPISNIHTTSQDHFPCTSIEMTMWTLVSKQNASTTCELHQFFCVAFFFERLSCFSKNKQQITHDDSFQVNRETLYS